MNTEKPTRGRPRVMASQSMVSWRDGENNFFERARFKTELTPTEQKLLGVTTNKPGISDFLRLAAIRLSEKVLGEKIEK